MVEPLRILVVDDDERVGELRRSLFESRGLQVKVANSLDEALEALDGALEVDVVVTDLNLSGAPGNLDGVALARKLRSEREDLPIVAYSAFYANRDLPEGVDEAFDGLFAKGSMRLTDIEDSIDLIMGLARQHRDRKED
jgi:CheY-like chemotaxis protein